MHTPHTAGVEAASTTEAAASTAASIRIIGNQTCANNDGRSETDESITEHGILLTMGAPLSQLRGDAAPSNPWHPPSRL
jgi:hypothetical protein